MRFTIITLGAFATFFAPTLADDSASTSTLTLSTEPTPAPMCTDNPAGAQYVATLPKDGTVDGAAVVNSASNGTGVNVYVSINNLPAQGGPFLYHIHVNPVAPNGSCSTVGGHLDPYNATDLVKCNMTEQDKCQVGDLSGKHGKANTSAFSASYLDDYISTVVGAPAFMGNRSLVVHYANKTIITCANFTTNGGSFPSPGSSSGGSGAAPAIMPVGGGGSSGSATSSGPSPAQTSGNAASGPTTTNALSILSSAQASLSSQAAAAGPPPSSGLAAPDPMGSAAAASQAAPSAPPTSAGSGQTTLIPVVIPAASTVTVVQSQSAD